MTTSADGTATVRVVLPVHLRTLAQTGDEVALRVDNPPTQHAILSALEARYPTLRGTIRDHATLKRRPFIRFFACGEDYSNAPPDAPLPPAVAAGSEPYLIVGAIAGG
jgi:sulfur-carrier protein